MRDLSVRPHPAEAAACLPACCVWRVQITLSPGGGGNPRKEIGPVSMAFEIPMYNVSNLQVRYLRISETHKSYNPYR